MIEEQKTKQTPEVTIESAMAQDYNELYSNQQQPAMHPDIRKAVWRSLLIVAICGLTIAGAVYYFKITP